MRTAFLLLIAPALLAADPTTDTPADVKKALETKTAVLLDVREDSCLQQRRQ